MTPPIKKLAVLFLIGSILTSSLAFGVSTFVNRASTDNAASGQAGIDEASSGLASRNGYRLYGGGQNGQNLTDEVVSVFARQLVEANPDGPEIQDGLIRILTPTSTELASYLSNNPASAELLSAPIDKTRVQIVEDFDQNDVSSYLSALAQIQSDLASNPVWRQGLRPADSQNFESAISWANASEQALGKARDDLYALKTPVPLLRFHRSALAFFSTTASFSQIMLNDPVAAVALSNDLETVMSAESAELEQAAEELKEKLPGIISGLPAEKRSNIAVLFDVPVAFAQGEVPSVDWQAIWENVTQWAKEFWKQYQSQIKSHAFGFMKNKLIETLQKKVLEVVKGKGVPNHVTNWLLYEADAALSAKFGFISRAQARLCGNAATEGAYGEILASAFGVPIEDAGVAGVEDTLGDVPGCPPASSGFHLRDGTYDAQNFLDALSHNTWNDMLDLGDQAARASAQASQAAVHEALSGRGSLDIKKCADGTPVDHEGRCGDGELAQVITPGSAIQDILTKSLGSAVDIITSANNQDTYSAVVAVLENAILNYLWKEGEGLFQNSSGGSTPPPPPDTSLEDQLTWYADQLETALSRTDSAISSYRQAIGVLQGSLPICGEDAAVQIQDLLDGFNSALTTFDAEAARIEGLLDIVHDFQGNPGAHTQGELNSRVGTAASITTLVTRATTDSSNARADADNAIELFQSCPAP